MGINAGKHAAIHQKKKTLGITNIARGEKNENIKKIKIVQQWANCIICN
jgi:hypothetical protein